MKVRLILLTFLGLLIECSPQPDTSVFLGGQIVQPSSSLVSLYFGNQVVDTFLLKKNTRFSRKYDSLPPGMYKVEHIPEFTPILMEPGDSLWVRINAADFQESLVFSGRGASKNNFLTDIRLALEAENNFLSTQYARSPLAFKQSIDSLLSLKKQTWIQMNATNGLSPYAQKITQAAYVYAYAGLRERYALLRGKTWDSVQKQQFFGYRKFLNYGENDLAFFDPYITYLINYLNRESLLPGENYLTARFNTDFNIRRLKNIQNKIYGKLVQNNLARAVAYEELLNFENHSKHDKFLNYYFEINTSPSYKEEIVALHGDINQMDAGKKLPEIILQNTQLELLSSHQLFDQPTVIYFWSQTQMSHFKDTVDRVNALKKKYPNYRFVGISIQPLNPLALEVYKMMDLPLENQYGIVDFGSASKKWVITLLNKTMIMDASGIIQNGFANIMAADFEKAL